MAKIVDGYDFSGKSLLITAKVDGFRRGGCRHSATETLRSVDEFSDEQLGQILAESGQNLIVKVVEVKGMEGGGQPPAVPENALKLVKAAIAELEAAGDKINVANLTAKAGFKVSGALKDQAIAEMAEK
ncbi:MAG: hypothetical protein KHX55_04025 [Proteobacteria bacterium]|nr:hypothetical protein [Pseudomonadota bacterium]